MRHLLIILALVGLILIVVAVHNHYFKDTVTLVDQPQDGQTLNCKPLPNGDLECRPQQP